MGTVLSRLTNRDTVFSLTKYMNVETLTKRLYLYCVF